MKKRIITAIILAIILVPSILIPALLPVFEVILMLFTAIATVELLCMYDKEKKVPIPVKILTIVLTMMLYFSIVNSFDICKNSLICQFLQGIKVNRVFEPTLILLTILIALMTCLIFVPDFEASDLGKLFIAIIYVGVCVAAFTILRYYGVRFVIYLLLVSIFTDIFALVFGLSLGKHKMAPAISPKKTWEGAIGGTTVAIIIGCLFIFFYPELASGLKLGAKIDFFSGVFNYSEFTLLGKVSCVVLLSLLLSICSQIGDLVASKLKRTYGIKDYSNIFPGHGGVLDRFDSTLFASAIFLLFIMVERNIFF